MESVDIKEIDRQYRVVKRLGEGLSGEVFHVRKEKEEWALKLLKAAPESADPEGWIDAFKFEFSLLKDIQHPNVVKIGDFGWDRGLNRLYYTQEFLKGVPLHVFLEDRDFATAEDLFLQALKGLEAIHNAQALHGDIKPSNMFVLEPSGAKRPSLKILDLGMAHPRLRSGSGTPAYMAPEKVLGDAVDERSDLYALGLSFYESLTGANPFLKEGSSESLKAQTAVVAAPAGTLNPEIPPYFNRILMQLLAKNPHDRFRTARAVLNEMALARNESTDETAGNEAVVSERWVGRLDAVETIRAWVREKSPFSLLAVTGEKGSGKSRLMQEMKYEMELEGREKEVFLLDEDAFETPVDWNPLIEVFDAKARGIVIAVSEEGLAGLKAAASKRNIPLTALTLKNFRPEEIRTLIRLSSRDENPPMTLAMAVFEETRGHPGKTVQLLTALCRHKRLVDSEGKWNLAVFREGGLDLALSDQPVADEELSRVGDDRPDERTELLLRKMRDALRSGATEGLSDLLKESERVVKLIPEKEVRLKRRAEIFERKAWGAILSGKIYEAQGEIEAAKSLLEEAPGTDRTLLLRLQNFEAFALMRTGRIDEAIALFTETHRTWEKELSEEEKALVVNNDLAAALMQKGSHPEAVEIQKEFLKFFEKRGDEAQALRAHYQLGECYLKTEALKKATEHYRSAASSARRLRKWDMLLRAYNGLGNALNLQHKPHEGVEHYRRALDLARYLKDYAAAAAVAQNVGAIEKDLGLEEPARENLLLSLKLLSQVPEPTPYVISLKLRATLELGELARERGDFETARDLLSDARKLAASDKSLEPFSFFVYQALSLLALDQGRFDDFSALYPDLLYHAKTSEQKERVEFLKKRSPVDPSLPRSAKEEITEPNPRRTQTSQSVKTPHEDASWLRALLEVNQSLLTEKDPDRLLTLILRHALALSSGESGLVLLADASGKLTVAASMNIEASEDLSQVSRSFAERVLREGRPLKTDDAQSDRDLKSQQSVILLGLKSMIGAPIRAEQKVIGVLYLVHRFRLALFDTRTETILQAFADQAGLAIENARLIATIAAKNQSLEHELKEAEERIDSYQALLRDRLPGQREAYAQIVAASAAMEKVFHLLDRISASNLSVLVCGESGTGKELIARALHQNSPRRKGKFVAINCGALPENLIESELFGYKAGAFTDARTDKKGLLEEASGGTIFFDEIGELQPRLQVKLLRALQEREIVRLGDATPIPIDVRVVSATHQDVRRRIGEGLFREDLFYRIAEIQVDLPPLRERKEDIPLLIGHFLKRYAEEQGSTKTPPKPPKVSRDLLKAFLAYPWPGNVRELGNRVRVACALSDGKTLQLADLPDNDRRALASPQPSVQKPPSSPISQPSTPDFFKDMLHQGKSWRDIETVITAKALLHYDFDVVRASKSLGLGQATLYNRLRREKFKRRRAELEAIPYRYPGETPMEDLKRNVFRLAYEINDEKPYQAARQLKVSPGMFYRWTQKVGE